MMKKAVITIMMLAAVCLAQGPAQAWEAFRTNDGNYVRTYDCSQFSKISIGDVVAVPGANRHINFRTMGDLSVKLVRSDECRVELSVNYEEYADFFHANLEDGVLYVKVSASNESLKPRPEATITVFTPSLEELDIHGISRVMSEGTFGGKTVSVKIGGVSTLSGLSVEADTADLMDLKCRKVTVDLHNVCSASVYASEYLNYNVADRTCYLDYYGQPETVTGKGPEIITKH